ncbi:MAG: hypothetical protein QOF20_1207 [Acidimicrobiaceae bacterium]|jgi:uncharacterized membrane protein YjfL (UPF0719 family)|nr:hypothetical protein [Acidimicrobiaceae bacterium]MDQ1366175.1 hypothetical protein [Acidimicrobiaceae bacterium]MDQ1368854.1 hypothetical protein [Acidimicrobiaceae bacterium]MDQ1399119.1 hypothetical protein [Acidimicrobiaceae bacterium]MDQ1414193.1 hypothetical protein [Acidimicrobiaceae bacterium]
MTSADWTAIAHGLGRTFSYLGVGVVLLAVGFHVLDLLTPGKLAEFIMTQRNRNAARVASAAMLSLAIVIATAVLTTNDDFAFGLVSTAIFGAVGVLLQTVVYVVLDRLTPGRLGDVVCATEDHPGSWVLAASLLAAGVIVAACIS